MTDSAKQAIWVRCKKRAWVRGHIEDKEEKDGKFTFKVRKEPQDDDSNDSHDGYDEDDEFITIESESQNISSHPDMFLCNEFDDGTTLADIEDLTWLTHLHEPSILQSLSDRFDKDKIYTNTGPILIAVNPFKRINIYGVDLLEMYYSTGLLRSQGLEAPNLGPHVYKTADNAYRSLVDTQESGSKNQSILVSGESGAGKTESTKFVMQYLATVACDDNDKDGKKIADMVLQSNPILEAFGNARTTRNDNSSRFGKFIEMQFNKKGMLVGARIVTYLLEKVRLAKQGIGERNFHVFYQLVRGATEEQITKWKVPQLEDTSITNQSECYDRQDDVEDDDQFERMWKAMGIMGFPDEEKEQLMCVVSAVMNLGNIHFVEDENESTEGEKCDVDPDTENSLTACSELLGVPSDALSLALRTRKIKVGANFIEKPLSVAEANDARDALAKSIYSKNFDRVVRIVNESIQVSAKVKTNFIGVLDIFGFEVFQSNSFEQLCINYANETLQQHFNQFVFKLEQKEYEKEKIKWSFIDFPDNQACLDLIEKKPIGIIALLDEQCLFPKGNDESLARKFYEKLVGVERFSASNKEKVSFQFTVEHYAGAVSYDSFGFVAKNKDQLYQESLEVMQTSTVPLIKELFAKPKGSGSSSNDKGKNRSIQSKTVGSQFKEQLTTLLKTIRSTSPHYVRCLKPNDVATAGKFGRQRIVDQLRYGGVLEAVKVARAGYPVRMLLADFVSRYFMLSPTVSKQGVQRARKDGDGRPGTVEIVKTLGLEEETEYQIGKTKIFLRKGAYEKMEDMRLASMKVMATKIQALARARQHFAKYGALVRATRKLQKVSRGMLGRSKARNVRNSKAATKIQTLTRVVLAKMYVSKCVRSIRQIQRSYRAYRARVLGAQLERDNAILRIQAWSRGLPARSAFLAQQRKITVIQTMVRGKLARQTRKRLRIEAKQVGNLQTKLSDLTNRVKELEAELEEEKSAHEELKTKYAAVAAAAAATTTTTEPKEVEQETEATPQVVQDGGLSSQVVELKQQLEERDAEIEKLRATFAATSTTAAVVSNDKSLPEESNSDNNEYASKLESELASANETIQKLTKELEQQNIGDSGEIATLAASATSADSTELALLKEKVQELEDQLDVERRKAAAGAAVGVAGSAAAVATAAASSESNDASVSASSSVAAISSDEAERYNAKIQELEGLVEDLKKENEVLKETSPEIKELERERDELISQLEQNIGRMCDAENRCNDMEHDLSKHKRANKSLEEKLESLTQLHATASGVKIALAKRLEVLILENRTLRSSAAETDDEISKLQQENQILRARVGK